MYLRKTGRHNRDDLSSHHCSKVITYAQSAPNTLGLNQPGHSHQYKKGLTMKIDRDPTKEEAKRMADLFDRLIQVVLKYMEKAEKAGRQPESQAEIMAALVQVVSRTIVAISDDKELALVGTRLFIERLYINVDLYTDEEVKTEGVNDLTIN